MKALIIAAGNGNRLRKFAENRPKPLFKVAGLSLIERTILSAKKAGITDFVIVIGYQGDQIRKKLLKDRKRLGVSIEFVENPDWSRPNGHSVLQARALIQDDFVLLMSDHVFDWRILENLLQRKPAEGGVLLAVDKRVGTIFDLDDATKVKTTDGAIAEIGKGIGDYDAVDTGIFYCSTGIFPALERVCREGKGSLSEAIGLLASEEKAGAFKIGDQYWQDVDTPRSLKEAERILFRSVRKETDGMISRHFNRKISGLITRLLVKTPLTANQVSWSALVVGLLSGFLISRGDYRSVALGGILFQFASIYDGCDGEMAKLKGSSTKFGEWLDTICDNITYIAFFIGVIVGVQRQGFQHLLPLSLLVLFGLFMSLTVMYLYLARFTNSGSLVTVQKDLTRDLELHPQNRFVRAVMKMKFVAKRDFFALLFMVLCLLNRLDWVLICAAIGTNIPWIVLLTMKREFAPSGKAAPSLQEE